MFYILEKKDQLSHLEPFKDCFIDFIQGNDNFHPTLSSLSLIYIRDITQHKGYILCLNHNESFSLKQQDVFDWILNNTDKLFVLDKKQALYHFPYMDKLYDINFIEHSNLTSINIPAISYYYHTHINYPTVNNIIPISKHYEKNEKTFNIILPVIQKYRADNALYAFNNGHLTRVFHNIESQGIKVDKQCFIDCYGTGLQYPEFNIRKGKIYSRYNLHTITGRPSNTYNSINFAALNKTSGERLCYKPANDMFVEFDYKAFHIAILSNLIGYKWEGADIHNELGMKYFNTDHITEEEYKESKTITFSQIYGYIREEYKSIPFFKQMQKYIDKTWKHFQSKQCISTDTRTFTPTNIEDITPNKLLNYIIQSYETSINIDILSEVIEYLKDKKSNVVLYVYDSYLIDLDKDEYNIIEDIKNIINKKGYNVGIKTGKNYQALLKIQKPNNE